VYEYEHEYECTDRYEYCLCMMYGVCLGGAAAREEKKLKAMK
jgi:hypothetical protein